MNWTTMEWVRRIMKFPWLTATFLAALPAGTSELAPPEATAPRWFQGTFFASIGLDYSSGGYGASSDTEILYVPVSLGYRFEGLSVTETTRDEFELRVTVPYLDIDGPASTGARMNDSRDVDRGLGDVVVRGTYRYFPERLPAIELTGRVKIPTGDPQQGLGTGETDYSLEVGLAKRLGAVSTFGSVGYRFRGDAKARFATQPRVRLSLNDGFFTSIGASIRITPRLGVGLSYDWRAAASSIGDGHELVPFFWFDWTKRIRLTPYAVAGLAQGSPDFAAGLSIQFAQPIH